ncbi:hypothetical protein BBJ28_00005533 [Nothophytophthora sp. Chile5]|nr:hypothetical protein BBJ28_00005533 [Nothophytophthora sp. Chile5]
MLPLRLPKLRAAGLSGMVNGSMRLSSRCQARIRPTQSLCTSFLQEKLLEYELSIQDRHRCEKPKVPEPKYSLSFYSAEEVKEMADLQRQLLEENSRAVFEITANDVISAPHQTVDGAWRSVRHVDLRIRDDQQQLVSDQASNIGVYVPNDLPVVGRMLAHLHVVDPEVVFTAEPLPAAVPVDDDDQKSSPQYQGFPNRPFSHVGTVRDALTWTFDLISTPRSSFLRSLAAYATDDEDIAALTAPGAAEALRSER